MMNARITTTTITIAATLSKVLFWLVVSSAVEELDDSSDVSLLTVWLVEFVGIMKRVVVELVVNSSVVVGGGV